MANTAAEYDAVIKICKGLFMKKTRDYGTAWRILRIESITDQIFIKAQRIRTLEEKKVSKVDERYCQRIHRHCKLLRYSHDAAGLRAGYANRTLR